MKRLVTAALFFGACSPSSFFHSPDGGPPGSGADAPGLPIDGTNGDGPVVSVDADTADAAWQWQTLIANPGFEINGCMPQGSSTSCAMPSYSTACAQIPITSDMWIDGFRPGSGGVSDLASDYQSDVPTDDHRFIIVSAVGCGASELSYTWHQGDEIVYAAGLGSNAEFMLPQGTAVHLAPMNANNQQQYLLIFDRLVNYYNTTAMNGASQVEAHFVQGSTTGLQAVDMVLGGQATFSAPTGGTTTVGGLCTPIGTAGYQWNIVALWPHMHASGNHSKVWITRADGVTTQTLYDAAFTYKQEGTQVLSAPVVLGQDDHLEVDCGIDAQVQTLQYDEVVPEQDFGRTVCWTGIYKYPPGTDTLTGTPTGPETCLAGNGDRGFTNP